MTKKSEIKKKELGRLNMWPLLDMRDQSIVHPENYQIGSFRMCRETINRIAKEFEQENLESLYGFKIVEDSQIPPGGVTVLDKENEVIDRVIVAQ